MHTLDIPVRHMLLQKNAETSCLSYVLELLMNTVYLKSANIGHEAYNFFVRSRFLHCDDNFAYFCVDCVKYITDKTNAEIKYTRDKTCIR